MGTRRRQLTQNTIGSSSSTLRRSCFLRASITGFPKESRSGHCHAGLSSEDGLPTLVHPLLYRFPEGRTIPLRMFPLLKTFPKDSIQHVAEGSPNQIPVKNSGRKTEVLLHVVLNSSNSALFDRKVERRDVQTSQWSEYALFKPT
jgi:hypothetical protein